MTPADFKTAVTLARLSLDGRATYGALLVLVDGHKVNDAAASAECSEQAVRTSIRKITRAALACPYCGAKRRASEVPGKP